MREYLLYFQFVFLYLPLVVIGLAVYGSDFDSISGWLYLVPLLTMPAVHRWVWKYRRALDNPGPYKTIAVIGGVCAVLAYRPLHMGYWDEHSLTQALLIAVTGVCAYLLSVAAAGRIDTQKRRQAKAQIMALLLIGALWSVSAAYPMFPLFALGVTLLFAAFWHEPVSFPPSSKPEHDKLPSDPIAVLMLFVVALDSGLVVWDYQVNTAWGLYLAGTFFAAAGATYLDRFRTGRLEQAIYAVAVLNIVLAAVWPAYILNPLHSLVGGYILGFLLHRVILSRYGDYNGHLTFRWMVWFVVGFALGYGFYANLQYAHWRVMFVLVPLTIYVLFVVGSRLFLTRN
jgi:hypothetical protein